MIEININNILDDGLCLSPNIDKNLKIIGEIDTLYVSNVFEELDLSNIICNELIYQCQDGESIINHKLPNKLDLLSICRIGLENYLIYQLN